MAGGGKTKTTENTSNTQTVQLPPWLTQAGQDLWQGASGAAAANPIQAYNGPMTPGMAPNQAAAGQMAAGGSPRPGGFQPMTGGHRPAPSGTGGQMHPPGGEASPWAPPMSGGGGPSWYDMATGATMGAMNPNYPTVTAQQTGAAVMSPSSSTATGYQPSTQGWAPTVSADLVGTGVFDQAAADRYMSPYLANVQGRTTDEMRRQNEIEHQGVNDAAAASKAYGGDRHALLEAEMMRGQNANMMDYLATSNQAGFENAQGQFERDRGARLTADLANQGANLQAGTTNASFLDALLGRNMGAENEAGQFNTGWMNQADEANAGRGQEAGRFNADSINTMGRANADRSLSASTTNAGLGQDFLNRLLSAGGQFTNIGNAAGADQSRQIQDLLQTGGIEQATEGDRLGSLYNEFLRMQDAPMERYRDLSAILNGTPRNVTTSGTGSSTGTSQQSGSLLNTLMGVAQIGGSIFGKAIASDPRLKRDVQLVDRRPDGLGIYLFHYLWDAATAPLHRGVMADEVARLRPDALGPPLFGFATVNYLQLGEAM